ncbi:MAG: hypothetical protein GC186_20075 [Rhodobacteraceae bacterium]|nr:hypothetical protein [Paracoccaceae bacterium]
MWQVIKCFGLDSAFNKSLMTSVVIAAITVIGIAGRAGMLSALSNYRHSRLAAPGLRDPRWRADPAPRRPDIASHAACSGWEIATFVAGRLIIVQGLKTTRHLGEEFSTDPRIYAARWSQ